MLTKQLAPEWGFSEGLFGTPLVVHVSDVCVTREVCTLSSSLVLVVFNISLSVLKYHIYQSEIRLKYTRSIVKRTLHAFVNT